MTQLHEDNTSYWTWIARLGNTDLPSASVTRFGSVSAALINVNSPIIPNWSVTIPFGMFEIIPETQIRQKDYEREDGKLGKIPHRRRQNKCQTYASSRKTKCLTSLYGIYDSNYPIGTGNELSEHHHDGLLPRWPPGGTSLSMCGLKGYCFSTVLVINRVSILAIMVLNRVWLLYRSLAFDRELKQTTTTTATRTSPNKSFNEQNNSCARAL